MVRVQFENEDDQISQAIMVESMNSWGCVTYYTHIGLDELLLCSVVFDMSYS